MVLTGGRYNRTPVMRRLHDGLDSMDAFIPFDGCEVTGFNNPKGNCGRPGPLMSILKGCSERFRKVSRFVPEVVSFAGSESS